MSNTQSPTPKTDKVAKCRKLITGEWNNESYIGPKLYEHAPHPERQLDEARRELKDKWGSCKVCGGEIPHGHTNNCDIYKLESELTLVRKVCDELAEDLTDMHNRHGFTSESLTKHSTLPHVLARKEQKK